MYAIPYGSSYSCLLKTSRDRKSTSFPRELVSALCHPCYSCISFISLNAKFLPQTFRPFPPIIFWIWRTYCAILSFSNFFCIWKHVSFCVLSWNEQTISTYEFYSANNPFSRPLITIAALVDCFQLVHTFAEAMSKTGLKMKTYSCWVRQKISSTHSMLWWHIPEKHVILWITWHLLSLTHLVITMIPRTTLKNSYLVTSPPIKKRKQK